MREIEVTWGVAFRVWFALTWRSILMTLAVAFAVGIVFGVVANLIGLPKEIRGNISGVLAFGVGMMASIFWIKRILNKTFRKFRITVVEAP